MRDTRACGIYALHYKCFPVTLIKVLQPFNHFEYTKMIYIHSSYCDSLDFRPKKKIVKFFISIHNFSPFYAVSIALDTDHILLTWSSRLRNVLCNHAAMHAKYIFLLNMMWIKKVTKFLRRVLLGKKMPQR